jgi:regulator of sigma E protease
MSQLLPSFGSAAFTIVAFVAALSIIVAIHEYGHYIVGRWSGIHAETFSLGFGPVLWSRLDRRGTRWQIAALPFGGYVKFLGDSNAASFGGEKGGRNTMLGAPLWARAATVAAGPIFNFVLSIVIFAGVILYNGRATEPLSYAGSTALPPAFAQPLQPGDELLAVDGHATPTIESFDSFISDLPVTPTLPYEIRRDGAEMSVQGPYPYPPMVLALNPSSAAYDAGLQVGDVITAVDGQPIYAFKQLVEIVSASDGRPLALDVWNNFDSRVVTLTPRRVDLPRPEGGFETRWLIGITGGLYFEPVTESPGLLAAVGDAASQIWFILASSLSGLWAMISGAISSCNLSGPIGIAQTSGAMASQGPVSFIWFVAVLSTAVGMLNLFPIPILDGGHLVFHAYEAITRRQPSDRALRILMSIGISLIGALMVFAFANDLFLCP